MRDDPQESAQDELGDSVRLIGGDDSFQPSPVLGVSIGVLAVRVDEDVDVREDQPLRSIRSSSAAVSSRSMPG